MSKNPERIRDDVRRKYAEIARTRPAAPHSCCGAPQKDAAAAEDAVNMIGDAYDGTAGYVADADLGLGCGLPVEHAGLQPGQTVVDLGSGAGFDLLIASEKVGPEGRVIGVDMNTDMLALARPTAEGLGAELVDFRVKQVEFVARVRESVYEQMRAERQQLATQTRAEGREAGAHGPWWVAAGLADVLCSEGIEAGVAVKRLMGQLDRRIKSLIDGGETGMLAEAEEDLLKNLLFCKQQLKV